MAYVLPFNIYYEDTDFSGVVYHANYLKYFERGREHYIGVDLLKHLYYQEGLGFVVYRLQINFRGAAVFGDQVEVETRATVDSAYRAIFHQSVGKPGEAKPLVDGQVDLVCVDPQKRPVPIPQSVLDIIEYHRQLEAASEGLVLG